MRNAPVGILFGGEILQPGAQETGHVVQKDAVGAKTWISPVQPNCSSRWGQSAGIPRNLHAPHNALMQAGDRGSEQANQPVRSRSEWHTTTQCISREFSRPTVHLDVAEAMEGESRLPGLHSAAMERIPVRGGRVSQRADAEFPCSSTSAWRSVMVRPRSPETVSRTRPTRF